MVKGKRGKYLAEQGQGTTTNSAHVFGLYLGHRSYYLQLISVLCIHPDSTERLPSSTVFYLEYPTGIKAHNLKVTLMIA